MLIKNSYGKLFYWTTSFVINSYCHKSEIFGNVYTIIYRDFILGEQWIRRFMGRF